VLQSSRHPWTTHDAAQGTSLLHKLSTSSANNCCLRYTDEAALAQTLALQRTNMHPGIPMTTVQPKYSKTYLTSRQPGCASSLCAPLTYDGAQWNGSSVSAILPGHQMEYCRRWRFISATARSPSPRTSAPVNFLQAYSTAQEKHSKHHELAEFSWLPAAPAHKSQHQ
jgi:hypothetical protein